MEPTRRRLSRKELLKLGLLGSAALALPLERAAKTQLSIEDRLASSQLPEPFQVILMDKDVPPPVARPVCSTADTDFYQMTMKATEVDILPGKKTMIFGYDGITPGPTIRADRGRNTVVRFINQLPFNTPFGHLNATSVHLHGNASEPQYDGWADDLTEPGQFKDYVYPNEQHERTLWYHDHAIEHTAENTYMGLAGFYITNEGLNLPLPKGKYDVPLMIQDKIFANSGQFIFDDGGSRGGHDSLFGDVILVNGHPWPVMQVERRKYLFRILNASVSRSYKLALSTDGPLTVVGHDGGLAPAPVDVGSFRIGMAERYGVVMDFEKYKIGDQIVLENRGLENNEEFSSTRQIMRFDVVSDATDKTNNEVPRVLVPSTANLNDPYDPMPLKESQARRTREFVFKRENGQWTVNGQTWEHGTVRANPGLDDVEIWRFTNKSGGWFHPIHVHLIDFKILDRNGGPPFPYEIGRKDTSYVGEGESVGVIAKFGPHEGKYMFHCHNTVHEDHDMMIAFKVGTGGTDPMSVKPQDLPPASDLCPRP